MYQRFKKLNKCIKCGEIISPNAIRCISCDRKRKRKFYYCVDCLSSCSSKAKRCRKCNNKYRKNKKYKRNKKLEYPNHYKMKKNRLIKLKEVNYKCEICDRRATQIHHIDFSKTNHNLNNLMALCDYCHRKKHKNF